ncbi:MAG: hypothetical protein M1831_002038 [Alyxoria varia]|nr:MAG: hypothetical protein M1831_002038 [Alyxoria varia]
MGNTSSSGKNNHSTGNSPRDAAHPPRDQTPTRRPPKRRESVHVLPPGRATAAPPSASLESAHGHSSQATAAQHTTSDFPASTTSHIRGRSQTSVAPDIISHDGSHSGNRDGEEPTTATDLSQRRPTTVHSSSREHSELDRPSAPMQVPRHPRPTDPNIQNTYTPPQKATPPSSSAFYAPQAQYNRPPRLPLPIEREVLSPGSPIISPADVSAPIGRDDVDDAEIRRKGSVLSSTTVDDDEVGEDFNAPAPPAGPTLDTLIEWKQDGERVYVTGSFSGWNKKHRLHRNGPSKDPNALSAMIPLPAGTHHLTFLVDGSMRVASHMPTAVDYTNVLINYIEVSVDDLPKPTAPVDIPGGARAPPRMPVENQQIPSSYHPPQTLPPPSPNLRPTAPSTAPSAGPSGIASPAEQKSAPGSQSHLPQQPQEEQTQAPADLARQKRFFTDKHYHNRIPKFLEDLDAAEDSTRFARASAVLSTQPVPPSLPMFLNKSILNGQLPMKDDASVLSMPNHTVLNHLATTSIKNHVLATSATTRYKRKYVTTILHKPTGEANS